MYSVYIKYYISSDLKTQVKYTHYVYTALGISRTFRPLLLYLILRILWQVGQGEPDSGRRVRTPLSLQPPPCPFLGGPDPCRGPGRCSPCTTGSPSPHHMGQSKAICEIESRTDLTYPLAGKSDIHFRMRD